MVVGGGLKQVENQWYKESNNSIKIFSDYT